mmetsp:Transcript_7841/g.24544  ORF Transcript_7841/g.24544 Transcript_7841/m.24544 type:complete len:395 (-) Transcript_7841:228-1412(-)
MLALASSVAAYFNTFPHADNPFGIKLPTEDIRNNSFAFLIADFGLATSAMSGKCCQTDVADLMRSKRAELERQGKQLLFVGAGGDNFYFTGLKDADRGGATQWQRWNTVYDGLHDVPWLAAMGNHDFGDSDVYATCPEKSPRVRVGGQAYSSNQLDADKGGYRPSIGNVHNFHMPDFNYRTTLDALNLEVYGLDQNYVDVSGIGGSPVGHAAVDMKCGGFQEDLARRLQDIGHSGEALLSEYAAKGAHDASQTRNVLVLQHYPGLCKGLRANFSASMPRGETLDFRCSFGHVHNTVCEEGTPEACESAMNGGGGGCCKTDVTHSQAGFGVLTFKPSGGMNIELVKLGKPCNFAPEGMSAEERQLAARHEHGHEHQSSFAAAKMEINAGLALVEA